MENGVRRETVISSIPADAALTDIGSQTAEHYQESSVLPKGCLSTDPMGVFEQAETELGTRTVWDALGDTDAYTVAGDGDSITATTKYEKTNRSIMSAQAAVH